MAKPGQFHAKCNYLSDCAQGGKYATELINMPGDPKK